MEKVLLCITITSALCSASSLPAREFHFIYDLKTWTEAQSYCRESYTDLVTIQNLEDVTILKNKADLTKRVYPDCYPLWIGLYDDVNSWRWSMSDPNFYQHDETFRNWLPGEPNNYAGAESCAKIRAAGQWGDDPCSSTENFICFNVNGLNAAFIFISTKMNWTDAQSYCRQHHTDLASVRNLSENQQVMKLIPSGQAAWIGLYRDTWKWSDGSNSSFTYWKSGEPNGDTENCGLANLDVSGGWEDRSCEMKNYFVCYSVPVPKQVVRLKLVSSSSVDLNDPVLLENLQKQLQQKLKDQGVNGNIRLSWRKQTDGEVFHKEKDQKKSRNEL